MKKSILLFGASLAVLASCSSGEYEDYADPQSNPQESAGSVVFAAAAGSAIDFNNVSTDSVQLFVPTLSSTAPVTKQGLCATLVSADGTASSKLHANEKGYVSASELQNAVKNLYGLSGDVHQIPTTITDTITVGTVGFVRQATVTSTVNLVAPSFNEFFYEIGNESGWSTSHALRSPSFDGKYEGWYYLNGEFKFKPNADNWDGDYEYNGTGKIADNGGDNCPDPGAGFYRINVDLTAGTYTLTQVNYMSLIGTVQGNWDTDLDMTYNQTEGCWEYTGQLNAGKFKIRMNHDWAYSWGGTASDTDYNNLTYNNGKDLAIDAAGTYKVQFYLTYEGNNKVVITKQ
jgi:hypothetical protein